MIELLVEISGENRPLARAETLGAVEALGGSVGTPGPPGLDDRGPFVRLRDADQARTLAGRLALAYRCITPLHPPDGTGRSEEDGGLPGGPFGSAAFRPLGSPGSDRPDPRRERLVASWLDHGGRIQLKDPERRFWYVPEGAGPYWIGEEIAVVDRAAYRARRMPQLPFRRPVSLAPKLARVAANLARIRPGGWVVDPFLGTGALLAEAALLGARVAGVDRSSEMIRGSIANFAHLGITAELLRLGDAGEAFPPGPDRSWDAILTDPPYGRSSGTGGEPIDRLLPRALRAWAPFVVPGGYLSVVVPTGTVVDLAPEWTLLESIPDRVHRSLTREFRIYRKG